MVWYGLNGAGRRPTRHLGSGRGQSSPGGLSLLPSGGPQNWGLTPRPARPALPLGTVAGSEFAAFAPPPSRTPSRKGALDSRPTGPSPRLPMGGSEGRPVICQFVVTATATPVAAPLALRLWRLGTALGARTRCWTERPPVAHPLESPTLPVSAGGDVPLLALAVSGRGSPDCSGFPVCGYLPHGSFSRARDRKWGEGGYTSA